MKRATRTTGGLALTDDQDVDDSKRVSNWFILINSNRRYKGEEGGVDVSEGIYAKILGATSKIFADQDGNPGEHLSQILDWKIPSLEPWSMKIEEKGEIGIKQFRVHVHMNVTVKHWGKLHLKYGLIKRLYKKYLTQPDETLPLGIINPFIDFEHYQTKAGAQHYLRKGKVLAEELDVLPSKLSSLSLD